MAAGEVQVTEDVDLVSRPRISGPVIGLVIAVIAVAGQLGDAELAAIGERLDGMGAAAPAVDAPHPAEAERRTAWEAGLTP